MPASAVAMDVESSTFGAQEGGAEPSALASTPLQQANGQPAVASFGGLPLTIPAGPHGQTASSDLAQIFHSAGLPPHLHNYLTDTSGICSVGEFLDYVVRRDMEQEWKDIIVEAFPVDEQSRMTPITQRLLVAKVRGAYRIAVELEGQLADKKAKRTKDEEETDFEKALAPEVLKGLKEAWAGLHSWNPVRFMKPAPQLRNRVYREFRAQSMTLHEVERAVTLQVSKKHQWRT